jgi:sugar phosphate isomerase/epimerase
MKLGYSAWSMPTTSVDDQIGHVAQIGFQGIELICIPGSSTDIDKLDPAERQRIRRLLDQSSLALPSIAAHANPIEPDPARLAVNLERIRSAFDLAADLAGREGPPCIVLMGYGTPESYESDRELLAERFRGLAEDARERGVTIGLEFHVGQAIDRPSRILWLVDRVNHPNFKLNLDTSHLDVMGYTIAESVRPLAKHAVHTHLKDQRGRYPNHEFLTPGDGDYDYVTYLKELAASGYDGFVTVEISLMVQRKPGYDPVGAARQTYRVLTTAAAEAGMQLG